MLIILYNLFWQLLLPFIPFWIFLRRIKGLEDKKRISERFGVSKLIRPSGQLIWIHAASIGESVSGAALAKGFVECGYQGSILLTTGTVSSAKTLLVNNEIIHQFHPYDYKKWVNRFLTHWKPNLAIMMESEIWPNLILCSRKLNIPLVMVSAQISNYSYKNWNKIKGDSTKKIFSSFNLILTTDNKQSKNFNALGASNIKNIGSLKVAFPPIKANPDIVNKLKNASKSRKIILAASTHEGEESIMIESVNLLKKMGLNCLLILAPRHIKRGVSINITNKLNAKLRSKNEFPTQYDSVWIADSFGEMPSLFEAADIVFIAGSLFPLGGHNPSEPSHYRSKIIIGPYVSKCSEIVSEMISKKAIIQVPKCKNYPKEISKIFLNLIKDTTMSDKLSQSAFNLTINWGERRIYAASLCIKFLNKKFNI